MVHLSDIFNRDHRHEYACIIYILKKCCPYTLENDRLKIYKIYKNLDFMQLKWIIDRCNFEAGKNFGLKFFDYDLLTLLEETDLVPRSFNIDWNCEYEEDVHGYIKKDKKGNPIKKKDIRRNNYSYMDWLSGADQYIMHKVIWRWKLYGKICVNISEWWYHLTHPIK